MFDSLQTKLDNIFKKISGRGTLGLKDIEATMKEVRLALLEADVHFTLAKDFCERVSKKCEGEDLLKSLRPDQLIIKIVYEELVHMLGENASELNLAVSPPAIIMLVGLQGSGKTTTSAKLGNLLRSEYKKKVLLVSVDVYRPAAKEQLATLGKQNNIEVYQSGQENNPVTIAKASREHALLHGFDILILDTAGRLQIDEELMRELKILSDCLTPQEILLVADSMTGQEAINVAKGFMQLLPLTGLILTKLDGDARGGAALSMRAVTGQPIKFVGVGEKSDALEVFHPPRMASRILGMGDVLTLIEKATKEVSLQDSQALQKKIRKNEFTLEDLHQQMSMLKRMGSISSLGSLIPGMGKIIKQVDSDKAEDEMKRMEAIILSMTPGEKRNHGIINGSRRRRIAKGSGTSVEEVNRLLKQFLEMKKMLSAVNKQGLGKIMSLLGRGM